MNETNEIKELFKHFDKAATNPEVRKLTSGHINRSFLVTDRNRKFVLQEVNTEVFKDAMQISQNILNVSSHLKRKKYPYPVLNLLSFSNGEILLSSKWRIFDFIADTQSFEKPQSAIQVYEAARFLSEFYLYINDLNPKLIKDSIPCFLDFNLRLQQFKTALNSTVNDRIKKAEKEIEFLTENKVILEKWNSALNQFPKRIIHADPKISNFLFDKNSDEKIIALIDWDTLMTGPLLYDFGDMARSYTNLAREEDGNAKEIFSPENYSALKDGFTFHLKDTLTEIEVENMDLAAQTVIYIQAVRFLTDYLNGDIYYHIHYPLQNLDRTKNQIQLMKELINFISSSKTMN